MHLRVGSWAAEGDLKSYLTLTAWRSRWRMFWRHRPAPRRRLSCSERTFPRNYRRRIAASPSTCAGRAALTRPSGHCEMCPDSGLGLASGGEPRATGHGAESGLLLAS